MNESASAQEEIYKKLTVDMSAFQSVIRETEETSHPNIFRLSSSSLQKHILPSIREIEGQETVNLCHITSRIKNAQPYNVDDPNRNRRDAKYFYAQARCSTSPGCKVKFIFLLKEKPNVTAERVGELRLWLKYSNFFLKSLTLKRFWIKNTWRARTRWRRKGERKKW